MRNFLNKIFSFLGSIGKDKYQHFTLGSLIAAVALCLSISLPFPAANFISIAAVLIIEMIKEFVIDGFKNASYKDMIATMLGGLPIWISASVVYANML